MRSCSILCLCLFALTGTAFGVTIPTVLVGDAGNAADSTGFGAVAYEYRIGTTEVTNSQYVEFLNAKATANNLLGLFNPNMASSVYGGILQSGPFGSHTYSVKSGMGNKPVNFVCFMDAARFANWLSNGQGNGSTETGAYTIIANSPLVTRNAGALWFVPSRDEWIKAGYYQPANSGGDVDDYWLYPTRSNDAPIEASVADPSFDIANPGFNVVNYNNNIQFLTSAGTAGPLSTSYYGTYDQGGNVAEYTDSLAPPNPGDRYTSNSSFGAGADYMWTTKLVARGSLASEEARSLGFRVATIPEPSTIALAAIGFLGLATIAQRRRAKSRAS